MILHGDCLDVMPTLDAASVDAVVCDPPAGISFMGKAWDGDKGGRDQWIAWLASVMRECYRVMKPGAHALVWALPRTSHWTGMALEDAGFEVRDRVTHLFGSGFPKSLDVSKAMDKQNGRPRVSREFQSWLSTQIKARYKSHVQLAAEMGVAESLLRHWIGKCGDQDEYPSVARYAELKRLLCFGDDYDTLIEWAEAEREVVGKYRGDMGGLGGRRLGPSGGDITTSATDLAKQWAGWGTALKPAAEDWWLARKPLIGTVATNVAAHGTGALNIDACRISTEGRWHIKLCSCVDLSGTIPAPIAAEATPPEGAVSSPSTVTASAAPTRNGKAAPSPAGTCRTATGCSAGMSAAAPSEAPATPTNSSTAPYGRPLTVPSLTDALSTTSTKSRPTTDSKTCSSCGGQITSPSTTKASPSAGRWPSNVVLDEDAAEMLDAQSGERKSGGREGVINGHIAYEGGPGNGGATAHPIAASVGGASRFFYCAKSSRREREAGLEGTPERQASSTSNGGRPGAVMTVGAASLRGEPAAPPSSRNIHPTVKPLALMRWLCRLVTPPGGLILDPFAGSGSTLCAAVLEGFRAIGIEREEEYVRIAERRVAHYACGNSGKGKSGSPPDSPLPLFGTPGTAGRDAPECESLSA